MLIGIDLGTTFSAVAHVNAEGKAEVIVNRDGERVTPSVVMFEDGTAVVGAQAKDNSVVNPFDVVQFIKRQMGQKTFSFDLSNEEHYSAEDISAMILKRLKEDAEEGTGESVEGVVITVPAYFDDAQRKATQDAGEIAGLKVLGIINEPTAAALAYCHGLAETDGNVMVFDLGGGTFDITVMRLSENMKKIDILATTGIRNMGGFDFDNAIISKVMDSFNEKYGIDLDDDDTAAQDLRLKAENAKKALSVRNKTTISIVSNGHALKTEITRDEFDELIRGHLDSMSVYMEMALEDANLDWRDLSKVMLVGGSTRIPAVQNMIKNMSGLDPSHELNPDEAVALGAAYYAESLSPESRECALKEIKIQDVNSHTLGVILLDEFQRERMAPVIKRNTPLPTMNEIPFQLVLDGHTMFDARIVEGEDEDPAYDTLIGKALIQFSPKPKDYVMKLVMAYDVNGVIHISVRDGQTNENLGEFDIERKANLSDSEIENKKEIMDGITVE